MPLYRGSLRKIMGSDQSGDQLLGHFSQILDGVEAAHLQGVVHRDLKSENVLISPTGDNLAVADFGVARFTEAELHTLVETTAGQRLANFLYAAPEQRVPGKQVGEAADIYALGLMLNELFTGQVPHGTDYQTIAVTAADFAFLDPVVASMIRQNPAERPPSVVAVKQAIQKYRAEAVSLQRLSEISKTVIKVGDIDDPLAQESPKLIGADWSEGRLTLTLDRPVHQKCRGPAEYGQLLIRLRKGPGDIQLPRGYRHRWRAGS
jgi:serine/threonine protein kinase